MDHLTGVRDEAYEGLIEAWQEAGPGAVRDGLSALLEVEALGKADWVVRGDGIGYYPRSHMSPIEGNCLVCAQGRLVIDAKEVWKGRERFEEAQQVFRLIARLPGHASHELPEVLEKAGGAGLAFLAVDRSGRSIEDIQRLDEVHAGRRGVWILAFPEDPVTVADMRSRGSIAPRYLLSWLAEGRFVPDASAGRIAATLQALSR
jgi:hypothetical protein